ncbi:2-C-methyl-D-erythritol 4-phosphate cytidylyltransferase [Peptoniphilus stercorisuis]|uniref:2-C-methyl-D-erythritol 4-phosphate cytidylyltransferase n=1 Tax=Peptoniphilus stercorisuis TaxID=1436965 RepID=A0ABS4KDU6_9FIRM|nr:2-C-methyl-D-erythritol 4-phosphate cytidylyltransferase [Peptoniphilus stercorisuis]MBP2025934.1 2-C-methyl-D-erythritol 4-phosphate cytidylyltransferase [Peptoniphilus stercorisuis]
MYNSNYVTAIVAAAGMGKRMKKAINKQFLTIKDKPILAHTLNKIEKCDYIDFIIILIKQSDINYVGQILNEYGLKKPFKIVYGGEERQDSIAHGLKNMPEETNIVITHDGARPFVSVEKINEVIEKVFLTGAATLANPVKDTIKISSNGDVVDYTPNRSVLWAVQTPQAFLIDVIKKAYKQAFDEGYYGTDDCSLVEKTGSKVKLILSDYNNIKITTPEDLIIAEAINELHEEE